MMCARHQRRRGRIHIGTSGWHYPHWVGPFYPSHLTSENFLTFYSEYFLSVEVNNTFYRLPKFQAVAGWRQQTPRDFIFACKASRFITHMKKLKDPDQSTPPFFEILPALGNKLGPVLFQLPPRWSVNLPRLEAFLQALPRTFRYAFEFRDESWFAKPTYDMLTAYQAACCLFHLNGWWSPEIVTADFVYSRLHGPDGPYKGTYDDRLIHRWAEKILGWSEAGLDVYCYFDNDEHGFAPRDAQRLQHVIRRSCPNRSDISG